jgi:hypothetical protein
MNKKFVVRLSVEERIHLESLVVKGWMTFSRFANVRTIGSDRSSEWTRPASNSSLFAKRGTRDAGGNGLRS